MNWPFLRALFGSLAVALAVPALAFASSRPRVLAIHFGLEVNPVTSSYLDHQLQRAQDDHYNAAVVLIDTPGGLLESMRKIVKKEIGLRIPVIVYVSPAGARAGSGTAARGDNPKRKLLRTRSCAFPANSSSTAAWP